MTSNVVRKSEQISPFFAHILSLKVFLSRVDFLTSLQKACCEERVSTEEKLEEMYPSVLQKDRFMIWGLSLSG